MQVQAEKRRIARLVWMDYYNRTLFERDVISEKEYNRMKIKIQEKYSSK